MTIIANKKQSEGSFFICNTCTVDDKRSTSSKLLLFYSEFCQNLCNNINSILSIFSYDLSCKISSAEKPCRNQKPCFIILSVFSPNDKLVFCMALALFVE